MSAVNRNLAAGTLHILMAVGRLNHIAAMIATDGVTNYFPHDDTSILLNIREKPVITDWLVGGAYRIRTGDLYNANVARYQLC